MDTNISEFEIMAPVGSHESVKAAFRVIQESDYKDSIFNLKIKG